MKWRPTSQSCYKWEQIYLQSTAHALDVSDGITDTAVPPRFFLPDASSSPSLLCPRVRAIILSWPPHTCSETSRPIYEGILHNTDGACSTTQNVFFCILFTSDLYNPKKNDDRIYFKYFHVSSFQTTGLPSDSKLELYFYSVRSISTFPF